MIICKSCGNSLPDEAKFCSVCGAPVSPAASDTPAPAQEPSAEEAKSAGLPGAGDSESASAGSWYQSAESAAAPQNASGVAFVPVVPQIGSIFDFYRKAFDVLRKKPIRLWGVSLLYILVSSIISSLGIFVPILSLPLVLLLSLGFTGVLLDGYHGREVCSEQLFQSFRKDQILRNGAGMCWYELWSMIWGFVPVMNIVKSYAYAFVPYILLTDQEIGATDALKKSMCMTDGYKAKMFWADLLVSLGISVAVMVLVVLSRIPYIGWIFLVVLVLLYLAVILFLPIFLGLVHTAIFEEIRKLGRE